MGTNAWYTAESPKRAEAAPLFNPIFLQRMLRCTTPLSAPAVGRTEYYSTFDPRGSTWALLPAHALQMEEVPQVLCSSSFLTSSSETKSAKQQVYRESASSGYNVLPEWTQFRSNWVPRVPRRPSMRASSAARSCQMLRTGAKTLSPGALTLNHFFSRVSSRLSDSNWEHLHKPNFQATGPIFATSLCR